MFKIITLTAWSLILSSSAFADYVCHRGDQNLKITYGPLNATGTKSDVKATLTTPSAEEVFTGTYSINNSQLWAYSMTNAQGEAVGLEMKWVRSYGGRCGRCGDSGSYTTYALLTLPNAEVQDFICD